MFTSLQCNVALFTGEFKLLNYITHAIDVKVIITIFNYIAHDLFEDIRIGYLTPKLLWCALHLLIKFEEAILLTILMLNSWNLF